MSFRRCLFLTLSLPIVILAIASSTAGGCGGTTNANGPDQAGLTLLPCFQQRDEHYDDYGSWDPCCNLKACCPSPNLDHFVDITKDPRFSHIWDPCCLAEPCPEVNVWLPKPEPAPPSAPDAGADAQTSLCPGQCATIPDVGWSSPVLLWHGPLGEEPSCPDQAPHEGYHGYADLDNPPNNCGICGCDSPLGECGLPSHLMASTNLCNSGGVMTPFNAPAEWDGSCTAQDAIPGGAQCSGGACVKSLSIDPLTLTETESCTPHVIVPKDGQPSEATWKTSALACQASEYPPCSLTQVCAPAAASGFSTCVFSWGDEHSCPAPYSARQVFYDDYSDTRTCTDCTCGASVGSVCTAQLSVYKDDKCVDPLVTNVPIDSTDPACTSILPPGLPLGSKAITKPTYTPGACKPSGGDQTGELAPLGAATFCCLQS